MYRNGPRDHPDVLGPTDNPGADFLKLGVGEALGLKIDYYVLVNMDGFSQLIDALGGITVNVNYWVPVNGVTSTGELPDDYIAPGPNQHMDGERALNYARGRFGLSDYLRMARQRCMINAIVKAADPVTLLSRYQQIAASTQNIVSTDIPQSVVGDFVDLALKVKDAGIKSVVFDDSVIKPAYPDYDKMRSLVEDALHPPSPGASSGPAPTAPSSATASGTPRPAPPRARRPPPRSTRRTPARTTRSPRSRPSPRASRPPRSVADRRCRHLPVAASVVSGTWDPGPHAPDRPGRPARHRP